MNLPPRSLNHSLYIYNFSIDLIFTVFFDQIINCGVEAFYQELGVRNAFTVWWYDHLAGNIFVFLGLNLYILYDTRNNFLEFYGYEARRYPDTPSATWPRPSVGGHLENLQDIGDLEDLGELGDLEDHGDIEDLGDIEVPASLPLRIVVHPIVH